MRNHKTIAVEKTSFYNYDVSRKFCFKTNVVTVTLKIIKIGSGSDKNGCGTHSVGGSVLLSKYCDGRINFQDTLFYSHAINGWEGRTGKMQQSQKVMSVEEVLFSLLRSDQMSDKVPDY